MKYGNIKFCDIADGEGVRTTLFVSGCTHHCQGCFQPETWSFDYGEEFTDEVAQEVLDSLSPGYVDGLTLLGGEPMEPQNQRVLVELVESAKRLYPGKGIWCYTGDIYEDLIDPESPRHTEVTERLLACIDVLVDGPFEQEKHDVTLRFRGSANQRILDLNASREAGSAVLWEGDAAFGKRGTW